MPTTARVLEIAPTCGYLASRDVQRGLSYKGEFLDPRTPILIYYIYKVLNTIYDEDNSYTGVVPVGNYLYALCSPWYFEASEIVDGGGGGQIPGVTPGGGTLNALDFEASSTSIIPTGDTTLLLDGSNGNPDWRGILVVNLSRGGIWQNTTSLGDGSWYYSWNSYTGLLTLLGNSPEAQEGELFRITPDAAGGTSTVGTQVFPFMVTSSDFEVDGVTLVDDRIPGNEIVLFANNYAGNFLIAPTDFIYISGGIEIVAPGFDANTFNYVIQVFKIN